jgi:hypothetical protein
MTDIPELRRSLPAQTPDGTKYRVVAAKKGQPFRGDMVSGAAAQRHRLAGPRRARPRRDRDQTEHQTPQDSRLANARGSLRATKLVVQFVQRLPHADPDLDTARTQVETCKVRIEELLSPVTGDDEGDGAIAAEASPAKLFEEIKVMFQDLPSRLESAALEDPRGPRSRLRRFHPGMLASRGEPRPGLAALMAASFLREDVPWLYEMAAEAYHCSVVDDNEAERRAVANFMRACEMASHAPFMRELRGGRDLHMLLRELPMIVGRFMSEPGKPPEPDE